jgi:DNA-binding response OmpR family regulator
VTEPGRPKRILVVDDEEDVQVLVCRILRDSGYDVDSASEGSEAIEKIRRDPPDLVVLDVVMPGVDGWGVLQHLQTQPVRPPVVVMTARSDFNTFSRGVREGAAAYVFKPFRFHELVATCQRVLLAESSRPALIHQERRRDPRRTLMVEVKVLSKDKQPVALGELVNLSLGGAQVSLGVPLDRGTRVRLGFHIPGGGFSLSLEGQVQWREGASDGFAHGLAFVALTSDDEQLLRDLLRPPF